MPGEIRIYFEGDKSLKAGFDAFFTEIKAYAKAAQWRVSVVATGGTPERDFGHRNEKASGSVEYPAAPQ